MSTETQALTHQTEMTTVEKAVIAGDLAALKPEERLSFYNRVCESLGLNSLTQPFAYLNLNGKLTLYARKDAAEQLRSIRGVSLSIVSREMIDGMYVVTCSGSIGNRTDSATGVIDLSNLKGEAKANAMMKAETKAKRRLTLSICGLGLLDETEVNSIPGARKITVEDAHSGKLLAAGNDTAQGKQDQSPVEPGPAAAGVSPTPAVTLDPRPIPDELRDAVAKIRIGDLGVIATADNFLKVKIVEACGTDAPYLKETEAFRKRYPKGQKFPYEAVVSLWLNLYAIAYAAEFAEQVNG